MLRPNPILILAATLAWWAALTSAGLRDHGPAPAAWRLLGPTGPGTPAWLDSGRTLPVAAEPRPATSQGCRPGGPDALPVPAAESLTPVLAHADAGSDPHAARGRSPRSARRTRAPPGG